jgi:hypothetical protein
VRPTILRPAIPLSTLPEDARVCPACHRWIEAGSRCEACEEERHEPRDDDGVIDDAPGGEELRRRQVRDLASPLPPAVGQGATRSLVSPEIQGVTHWPLEPALSLPFCEAHEWEGDRCPWCRRPGRVPPPLTNNCALSARL